LWVPCTHKDNIYTQTLSAFILSVPHMTDRNTTAVAIAKPSIHIHHGLPQQQTFSNMFQNAPEKRVLIINLHESIDMFPALALLTEPAVVLLRESAPEVDDLLESAASILVDKPNLVFVRLCHSNIQPFLYMMVGMCQWLSGIERISVIDRSLWTANTHSGDFKKQYLRCKKGENLCYPNTPTNLQTTLIQSYFADSICSFMAKHNNVTVFGTYGQYRDCYPAREQPSPETAPATESL